MAFFQQIVSGRVLRFGDFELETEHGVLSRAGRRLKLQPQPFRVLEYLVRRAPATVSREELGEAIWARVHVDLDLSLNYCIRQIRTALDDSATEPRYIETLPKQGYRFIATVAGPAVGIPAEEIAPAEGAGRSGPLAAEDEAESPVVDGRPSAADAAGMRGRGPVMAAASLLLLAGVGGGGFWAWRAASAEREGHAIRSIAVLPLENLSGDPGQEYFADGSTDELTTMLAKSSKLRIVSRTSVMQYKGVHRPVRGIARELGVDGIVEGSIARSGGSVHLNVQLIRAASDSHVWAEAYEQSAGAASPVREAAQAIAQQTGSAVPQRAAVRAVDPRAHDAYLRGRYVWSSGRFVAAGRYFREATELQPDYALAWSGLADYYGAGTLDDRTPLDPRVALPLSEQAARRAVELDDSLAQAHLSLGAAIYFHDWQFAEALHEISRALELDPKLSEAMHFRGKILFTLNRPQEAIEAERMASEMDPSARPWAVAAALWSARQYDAAWASAQQRLEADPQDPGTFWVLMGIYRSQGKTREATESMATYLELTGDAAAAAKVRGAFRQAGYAGVLRWQLSDVKIRSAKGYVSPLDFAWVYAQLRDREETLSALDEAYRQHAPAILWIQFDPVFDFLHGDERYRDLVRRIGMPPAY